MCGRMIYYPAESKGLLSDYSGRAGIIYSCARHTRMNAHLLSGFQAFSLRSLIPGTVSTQLHMMYLSSVKKLHSLSSD